MLALFHTQCLFDAHAFFLFLLSADRNFVCSKAFKALFVLTLGETMNGLVQFWGVTFEALKESQLNINPLIKSRKNTLVWGKQEEVEFLKNDHHKFKTNQ